MESVEQALLQTKYQSRYAQIYYILKTCRTPKRKADLYYTKPKKLQWNLLGELIDISVKAKLLIQTGEKYQTTEKGEVFLKKFEELLKLLKG
jgi:predicted transcriptional regulator